MIVHSSWNAIAIVYYGEQSFRTITRHGDEDIRSMGISGISQQLEDDVFAVADILGCLAPFGLRGLETYKAISEVMFDSEMAVTA